MQFIQTLFDGQLDIIGDIHGEIDALNALLAQLGYDVEGEHPQARKLIFVGDLCDRGPNSLAVIKKVKQLMDAGHAQCVLGNHELNLLIDAQREGNGWFYGSPHEDDHKAFQSIAASVEDREWILEFLQSLPLALDSSRLRVVHACWNNDAIQKLRELSTDSVAAAYQYYVQKIQQMGEQHGIVNEAKIEQQKYIHLLKNPEQAPPYLKALAQQDLMEQMENPIKLMTSGAEKLVDTLFYVGGKWRFIDRLAWWDEYKDQIPVVIGHYWRNFKSVEEKTGLFKQIEPLAWFGRHKNVFCVDYSVGKRYQDRQKMQPFSNQIGALRFPEMQLMLEDGTLFETQIE